MLKDPDNQMKFDDVIADLHAFTTYFMTDLMRSFFVNLEKYKTNDVTRHGGVCRVNKALLVF